MPELRKLWRRIEDLGFGWISIWDHFYAATFKADEPYCQEAIAAHAALAADTSKVRVGSLVYCAGYRHPAVLANAMCTIDQISNGRMEIGLGLAYAPHEFRAFGIPLRNRVSLTEELSRLKAERPGLAAEYAEKKTELDNRAKGVDAKRVEAMAEEKGVEGTGKVGRGQVYRQRMDELGKQQEFVKIQQDRVNDALNARREAFKGAALDARLATETVDVTLPVREAPVEVGRVHPISQVMDELTAILAPAVTAGMPGLPCSPHSHVATHGRCAAFAAVSPKLNARLLGP